jgi:SAM-dependent methyltransferase
MVTAARSLMARFAATARGTGKPTSPGYAMMSPPKVTWPRGTATAATEMAPAEMTPAAMTCPNCGSDVPKPLLLTIEFTTSPGSRKQTRVLRCPACGCPFYAEQIPPDYAEDAMLARGRVPFYLQQGAGLSLITKPLAQLRAPPGSVYAEIGCGFGFGLDYARHARNWSGRGIDPGGIASLGQQMLGVTIERRYLGDAEPKLAGTCDVVMASETIEHVLSPIGFVRVLRSMLRPGGTLILTTPDGADLRPETAPGVLIGLLSPGLHLIFQTADSLRRTLVEAGFSHIVLYKDGHSLVAFASDRAVELETDGAILKDEYRTWLERRSAGFALSDDLFLAFAGRALLEAVNDGAFDQARRALTLVEQACIARFGRSLQSLGEATSDLTGLSLEDLATRMPLSLGGLLYADAILRLASGTPRAGLAKRFLAAAAAADLLRVALADLAMADGMSEEIAWTARAEAVLCAAAAAAADVQVQLAALPPAPDAESGAARRDVITQRALVELVNAAHYQLAAELVTATGVDAGAWADADVSAPRSDSQRDALFCLAVLDSRSDQAAVIERSRGRFNRVRQMLQTQDGHGGPPGLYEAAVRGEVTARDRLRHHAAATDAAPMDASPADSGPADSGPADSGVLPSKRANR